MVDVLKAGIGVEIDKTGDKHGVCHGLPASVNASATRIKQIK